jgi:hypothetical protein
LCAYLATESIRRHVVDERLRAVDLDHRQQLPVTALEVVVSGDVDLAQVEVELGAQPLERRPSALAQVAPGRVVENDVGDYG